MQAQPVINSPQLHREPTTLRAASCASARQNGPISSSQPGVGGYVLWTYCFRYRGLLAEDDLYRMLVGLLDGARYGTYLASGSHYGKAFSFGYIAAIYRFADAHTLADPQLLIALINQIGFWAATAGCFFFWLLAWMLYSLRAATVAVIFSPSAP